MGRKFAHMFYSFAMSGETRWAKLPSCYPAKVNNVECRIKKRKDMLVVAICLAVYTVCVVTSPEFKKLDGKN